MSPKKRKRRTKEEDVYNLEELESLGIYEDESIEELDESESWRYYG